MQSATERTHFVTEVMEQGAALRAAVSLTASRRGRSYSQHGPKPLPARAASSLPAWALRNSHRS